MISLKFSLSMDDESLASEIKNLNNDSIKLINSKGLFGSEEITIAIIAAAPGIIAQIASVIKNYIDKNKSKSFSIKIGDEEMSFSGYSIKEIDEILLKYSSQTSDEN